MQWWCAAQTAAWDWSWRPYPGVWIFVLALGGAIWWLHRGSRDPSSPRVRWAALGVLALWIALDWPVGALGSGYLASVHMVQFLLIALVAPPLLLLGVPESAYRRIARQGWLVALLRPMTHPLVTLASFTVAIALTHWPVVVDTLMVSQWGSFALDMAWLVAGLQFWWPLVAPVPERPLFVAPVKIGYLIAATVLNTGVFAYLTFAHLPVYATYELAPPIPVLSTRDDQRLAGLIMKMGGAVVLWTAISVLFLGWQKTEVPDDLSDGGAAELSGSLRG